MVIMGPPLTLISIVKTQTGCRVPRREGLGPTGSHRVPPNPIWVPRREELGPTRNPTEPNLGPTVEKSADPPGPTKYVSGHVQGWWF